ncbi:circadian clock protein KaiC [Chenggangzhangella methanolivorans]|uniref:circadian clock protein KaiC n=1 Tax=Chenggangzhangella methanolivorans TaxID=1437009 RepID=UPI0021BD18F4|nr:circadian clock protein KaiC [Chenggangzhangella methanolivorans]
MTAQNLDHAPAGALPKARTGIAGLDAVTFGGLPAGRPTLICGAAGCGKSLFGATFLVNGATLFDEPGVLMSFEETDRDIAANVASLGYDVAGLVAAKKLAIDYVRVERSEIAESGEYDLEGLFVRLAYAIDEVGAKRVVLDTLEALFAGLDDESLLRSELRRLFAWLKERGVTAVITAERGDGALTRRGLEEYVSDCVILLDNRVADQITTRSLRIVKYRGSAHGTNEYPFLIDSEGISVLPVTTAGLAHDTTLDTVSSGIAGLDAMLGAGGFYRGASVLVTGGSGTGKTIFGAHFAAAASARGERCMLFGLEESPSQIIRNVRSVGVDLAPHVESGVLKLSSARPSLYGLEMHLTLMYRAIESFKPSVVVVDPISAFRGPSTEVHSMLLRMVDLLKAWGITALFTNLTSPGRDDATDHGLSSLMDTWIGLHDLESNGERNRGLFVLKSRGMSHSNQIREYVLTSQGVRLIEPYIGSAGVLTGTARLTQEAQERADHTARRQQVEKRLRKHQVKRDSAERQMAETRAALDAEAAEIQRLADEAEQREQDREADRAALSIARGAAE